MSLGLHAFFQCRHSSPCNPTEQPRQVVAWREHKSPLFRKANLVSWNKTVHWRTKVQIKLGEASSKTQVIHVLSKNMVDQWEIKTQCEVLWCFAHCDILVNDGQQHHTDTPAGAEVGEEEIERLFPSTARRITSCVSNLISIGSMAHCLLSCSYGQWQLRGGISYL